MLISRTGKQLRLLLWKNFTLKRRRPILLVVEILLPLAITAILVAVRMRELRFRYERCYLNEKYLDSSSPLLFARNFFCFFNTTCTNYTRIDWKENGDPPESLVFIQNISDVSKSLENVSLTWNNILLWAVTNPQEVIKLQGSLSYMQKSAGFINVTRKLMEELQKGKLKDETIDEFGQYACGTNQTDLKMLLSMVSFDTPSNTNSSSRVKRQTEVKQCQTETKKILYTNPYSKRIYRMLSPVIWGQIFYAPVSEFTKEIVRRANETFESLDYIRLAAIEWRVRFRSEVQYSLVNGSFGNNVRNILRVCSSLNRTRAFCLPLNDTMSVDNIIAGLDTISSLMLMIETVLNCVELNKFVPMPSVASIENLTSQVAENAFAGLIFNSQSEFASLSNPPKFLNYSIKMSTYRIDGTKNFKVLDRNWTPKPRITTLSDMKYYVSGFLNLQQSIDYAFTDLLAFPSKKENRYLKPSINEGSSIQIMPYPCYVVDQFIQFLSSIMPMLLVLSFSSSFTFLIKSIVYEKEKRLKEFMKVMGLTNAVHWIAWFIVSITMLTISVFLMTILISGFQVLQYTSPFIVFLLLFSYGVAITCQCFMISVFFSNTNIAGVVGSIIYFLLYLPYTIVVQQADSLNENAYYAMSLSAQVAFCNAFNFLSNWEQATVGGQFDNLFSSTVLNLNFGVGHCMMMLWVDSVIYLLITWYVENVFPGEYGVPRPFYFPFTKSYWCGNNHRNCGQEVLPNDFEQVVNTGQKSAFIRSSNDNKNFQEDTIFLPEFGMEPEPTNLNIGIAIKDMSKIYKSSKTPAVDHLNLNFYKSQITGFLGHNGAGKTTTISILTGIFPPSSGTAYILDKDIRTDIDDIREVVGLCPQHNILFDILTVEDHIYFYGLLKGLTLLEIKAEIPKIINDVGLNKKLNTFAKKLSGGMKRKLSIAMAFIGNSKVVFLDEPTAGVDPFARRGIWDLLVKYRNSDRTIILTTHHMDEADFLSDRIAIISKGKLKCCGSSVYLKRQFGDGYYLSLEKDLTKNSENIGIKSKGSINILNYIRQYIPSAKISEETRGGWMIALPFEDKNDNGDCNRFPKFFEKLNSDMESLGIVSYGISDTSLEEVFLKVAEETEDPGDVPIAINNRLSVQPGDIITEQQEEFMASDENNMSFDNVSDEEIKMNLLTGVKLVLQQMKGLQIKRLHYTKRNIKGLFSELLLPVIMILLMIIFLKTINNLEEQPQMIIQPWLMMPKDRDTNLYTFYRSEQFISNLTIMNKINLQNQILENQIRSDLDESGTRCMDSSVYQLPNRKCYSTHLSFWSPAPVNVSLKSPECDCNYTGMQICSASNSGGPTPSSRIMESSDILRNLTGYNISDHLMKNFLFYRSKQYGGLQMTLPSEFGISSEALAISNLWQSFGSILNVSTLDPYTMPYYLRAFFNISGKRTSYARIWVNTKGYASMPAYTNIFDNLILRKYAVKSNENPAQFGLSVANYPFKYSTSELFDQINRQMTLELSLAIFLILALSLIPASFVIFTVDENSSGSKRQQFVSGVSPYIYWLSTLIWDIAKYMLPVLCIIILFYAFDYQSYIGSKNGTAFCLLLISYGFGVIPHMYPLTFFFKVPSSAFVALYSYNILVGSITTISTFFIDLLEQDDPTLIPINKVLKKVFLVFPQYCVGRGMMDLSYNYLKYNVSEGILDYDVFGWDLIGDKLCAVYLMFVFWIFVLVLIESGLIQHRLLGRFKNYNLKKKEMVQSEEEDDDVRKENELIANTPQETYALQVKELVKIYNAGLNLKSACCKKNNYDEKRKLAVNNVSFGVNDGECFGLLGVNGAGKTTTFKMLTGEEMITRGEAFINGYSVINDINKAHTNMGFCPQFDALHGLLTCKEELWLYCRLRGLPSDKIKSTVSRSMAELNLLPHANKTTHTLSGGNKRKLSTAIALIGSPKVIFLDEPTAGMDAGARRFLWSRIQTLTSASNKELNKHAVVLTSHNMEECEVLCHRLAIMVDGQLKCIGSLPHLKAKFGGDYQIKIRLFLNQNRDIIKAIIKTRFGDSVVLQDENFVTLLYRFDPKEYPLSSVFGLFENLKRDQQLQDFSISQTTLDEIFVNFAKEKQIVRLLSTVLRKSISENGAANIIVSNAPIFQNDQQPPTFSSVDFSAQNEAYEDNGSLNFRTGDISKL